MSNKIEITEQEYAILEMAKLYANEKRARQSAEQSSKMYQEWYYREQKQLNELKDAQRLHTETKTGEATEKV
jgi:mevalonate pyrophosphate decarboxylase